MAGGKYTTYRVMARDAVDLAVADLPLQVAPSCTQVTPLIGRIYFLFRGDEPLSITIHGSTDQSLVLEPKTANRGQQNRPCRTWCRSYARIQGNTD